MPSLTPLGWTLCIVAVVLIGLAKGGFSGLGTLSTPLVALIMPPAQAAAVLLPVLIVQDAVSVWIFRREWDRWIVAWMLPGATVGIILGYVFAVSFNERALTGLIGLVTFSFGAYRLWVERGGRIVAASDSPGWVGTLFGVATGLTSQVSHSGAPPFQMWVTPRRLPHLRYVGTTAVLFAAINALKVPAYIAMHVLTLDVLKLSALLAPVAIASTLLSVRIIKRLDPKRFYHIIYWLMIALGAKLLADGFGL